MVVVWKEVTSQCQWPVVRVSPCPSLPVSVNPSVQCPSSLIEPIRKFLQFLKLPKRISTINRFRCHPDSLTKIGCAAACKEGRRSVQQNDIPARPVIAVQDSQND